MRLSISNYFHHNWGALVRDYLLTFYQIRALKYFLEITFIVQLLNEGLNYKLFINFLPY
jgi:hypothetical protein